MIIPNIYTVIIETKDNKSCLFFSASAGYQDYDIKYQVEANHRVHISIKVGRALTQIDRSLLLNRVEESKYHTEIIEKEEKTIINIYNENPLKDLTLRK